MSKKILFDLLRQIQFGKITIIDDGKRHDFSGAQGADKHHATINVKNRRVYRNIFFKGTLGVAESYINGDMEIDELTELFIIFIKNQSALLKLDGKVSKFFRFWRNLIARFRVNNVKLAKSNILAHYDLGNDFFKLFLDPTMMYSCAYFENDTMSLEEASKKKLAKICDDLQLKPSDHLLEIGTGWGGLAMFAVQNYGCKVTTTTISDEQYHYVKNEIKRLNLENNIELLNSDYRHLTGKYDKLVSIEMIEAVGYKHFNVFFKKCNELLKPGGLFALQAIVINDQAFSRAKNEVDFIKKYIFPGGCLPSIQAIENSITSQTQMQLIHLRDIAQHYVTTLHAWRKEFLKHKNEILQKNFSESFIRTWEFYFCYCAAGFATYYIGDIQALWTKRDY